MNSITHSSVIVKLCRKNLKLKLNKNEVRTFFLIGLLFKYLPSTILNILRLFGFLQSIKSCV